MKTLLAILFFAGNAYSGVPFWQAPGTSTSTAYGTGYLSGSLKIYPSTSTAVASPSIWLNGPSAQVTVRSGANVTTMSATGFAGALTGAASLNVLKAGDNMTGQLTASSITATAISSPQLKLNGVTISSTTAANYGGLYVSSHVFMNGDVHATNLYGNGANITAIANASIDSSSVTKQGLIVSSITLSAMYGAPTLTGTNFTAIPNAALVTEVIPSSATGNYLLRVATATYLATAPGACTAGQYISGMTADGTKTCGTPAGAGDVVLAATQTFTGGNTFTSSVTIAGSIVGNLNVQGRVIPTIYNASNSSYTLIGADLLTQTTMINCFAGSTVTITTNGGSVLVTHTGGTYTGSSGIPYGYSFKQDGAFVSPLAANVPIMNLTAINAVSSPVSGNFTYLISPSAGTHSYCLTAYANSGTVGAYGQGCRFGVVELK